MSQFSFISILQFSEYRSFTFLDQFIPRYFILFDAVVNGIVSFISLSDLTLLVNSNARDFCVLILYLSALLNSLVSFKRIQMNLFIKHKKIHTHRKQAYDYQKGGERRIN